jgi:acetylornithine deacetylase/succinyl-diaminopimelate desuccinylase-like protein
VGDPATARVVNAVTEASGQTPILVPSFGSSMPLHLFGVLEAPAVIVPIANYDGNPHGPNENLRVGNLWYGIDLVAALLG